MVKAVFFDIDGTLVSFTTHTIPESTRRALQALRQNGVKVFIATGRPNRYTYRRWRTSGLTASWP